VLDTETVVRVPHDAVARVKDGKKRVDVRDPRVSVEMHDQGCTVLLFFESMALDAQLLEVRILPDAPVFEPFSVMPRAGLYARYARAALAHKHGDAEAALRALRGAGATRRGLSPEFYRQIAEQYNGLIAEGVRHPVKTLAEMQHVKISTASRWITKARELDYLKDGTDA
jgi:hypothetical protein